MLDTAGLPIPGATLEAWSPVLSGTRTTTSGADGTWAFLELPPGTYTIRASHPGLRTVERTGIYIVAGRTTRVDFKLAQAVTPVEIAIVSGRSYQSVAAYGVSGGGNPNTGGAAMNENTYIDDPPLPQGWTPADQDQYAALDENVFVPVADTPLSTFGVDVDTASYSNVRRWLESGQLPPRDAVRIEEMVNYFPMSYAPPEDDAPFVARAEVTGAPWAPGHRLVRIGIQGIVPAGETPPRNLVFLVDVSGSMSGPDRLPLVQEGLELLARQLGRRDTVSIVTYAGAAGIPLPPTSGDHTAEILGAVRALSAGGATAGAEGIRTAYELARRRFDPRAVNRVILATDGDFNVGVSNESDLLQLIEKERESGVFLTVLGVGRGNLQDAKMELLADHGNGQFAYLDGGQELRKVFQEQLAGTLVPIAKDVKVQVEFNPERVASYRLLGYENRVLADRDFDDDRKDAGEIGAGHSVTALYEVVPVTGPPAPGRSLRYQSARVPTPAAASGELLTVHLRHKAPDGEVSRLQSFTVVDDGAPFELASVDTRWAAAVAGFGMLLRHSPHAGALDWDLVRRLARDALGEDALGYRAEMLGLIEKARRLDRPAASTLDGPGSSPEPGAPPSTPAVSPRR